MSASPDTRPFTFPVLCGAIGLGLVALGCLQFRQDSSELAAIWLPNALLVAMLLRGNGEQDGRIITAALFANIAAGMIAGTPIVRSIITSVVNALEISATLLSMRRIGLPHPDMTNLRDLTTFTAVASVGAPMAGGAAAGLLLGLPGGSGIIDLWRGWSVTNGLGMLMIAAPAMAATDAWRARQWPSLSTLVETAMMWLATAGTAIFVFSQTRYPYLFLIVPVVWLCAFRVGPVGTVGAILTAAVIGAVATSQHRGPIHLDDTAPLSLLLVLQIFVAGSLAIGLPIVAALADRRRLQEALKQSLADFDHVTKAAPIGIFRANAAGQLTFINQVWSDKLGLSVDQMLGNGWMKALKPTAGVAAEPVQQWLSKPGMVHRRVDCFQAADGSDLWLETVSSAEMDENGKVTGFVGAAHDITEQRAASERLAESEQRFQALAHLAPAGIFRTDANGACTYVNTAWLHTTGLKDGEWENDGWMRALHPDDRVRALAEWASAAEQQRGYRSEFRWIRPDGSFSWVDVVSQPEYAVSGSFIGFIGVSIDVTDRHIAEQTLAEREEQLRLLAANATDAVFRIALDGTCVYASPSAHSLLEVPFGTLVGTQLLIGFHPHDDAAVRQAFADLSSGLIEDCTVAFRVEATGQQGDYRWLEAHCGSVPDAAGKAHEIIASIRDVSRNKALEEELRQARQLAEAATATKAAFLANMSHEIRTPMNGVLGFTELLGMSELSDEQRRHVDLIADSGRAMMRLLNDILDISKIDSGQMEIASETFDLHHKLNSAARLMEPIAQSKGVTIEIDVDPSLPQFITGDRLRFRQIMLNLIGNAVKFTDVGSIRISAHREAGQAGSDLIIAVKDSGIGIAANRLEQIFGQFSQADTSIARKYGGTGLGLAISYNLATLMGGRIDVESVLDEGTTFTVRLPLLEGETRPREQDPTTDLAGSPQAQSEQTRVLIAEDYDINQMLILGMAKAVGLDADIAADGSQAVAMVEAAALAGKPYKLVFMDMQMPGVDGLEATRRLRAGGFSAETLPIVALTANAYSEDVEACRDAGMQDHLAKPVRLRDIKEAVARFVSADAAIAAQPARTQPSVADAHGKTAAERYAERRMDTLHAVAVAARCGELNGATVAQLVSMLHKLAGSAGFFNEVPLGKIAAATERRLRECAPDNWVAVVAEGDRALERAAAR